MPELSSTGAMQSIYSKEASRDFFLDPFSYTDFDTTRPDFRRMIGCVEPRNEDRGAKRIKAVMQGAGGGVGDALDRSLVIYSQEGRLLSVEDALEEEIADRGESVLGGHFRCKFVTGMPLILAEMMSPSPYTMEDLDRTARKYQVAQDMKRVLPNIIDAAKAQHEHIEELGASESLVEVVGRHYPEHSNVCEVMDENQSEIYLTNNTRHAALNRDKKAKQRNKGIDIQGYHESRRANFGDIFTSTLSREQRRLRVAAFMLRSSAARTVLVSLRPDTEVYEITHSNQGLIFTQQEGLN